MSLENLRKKIDEVDARIVELIGERLKIVEDIGAGKKQENRLIEDREREEKVLETVKNIARSKGISPEAMAGIYKQIMAVGKGIQGMEVAFQGEVGAYSEEAVFRFFGLSTRIRPCESVEEVFTTAEKDEVQFAVVPVENSLEGVISRVYDLLLDSKLMVYGEVGVRVIHCLIASPGASLDTIKKVYSHPQALGQCRRFLKQLNCQLIPTYDTAGSVKIIKEQGALDSAAVASARAAEVYGMKIIAQEIEDNPNNFTRFFVLSKADAPPTGKDKTSIVFSTKDRPGALYEALWEFASRKVNLTKLESRPTRQKAWEYYFYVDFEGHRQDKVVREALEGLEKVSVFMKVLGSYPRTM